MSQQSQPQNDSREQHYQQLDAIQRRQTRRNIILPFLVLLAILAIIIGVVVSLRTPKQVAVLSDLMLTLFVLCPLVICMFPIVVLMLLLVAMMSRLHTKTKSPLRRLEQWTYTMEKKIESWASVIDGRVLNWAVRFAPIRRILTIFDEPSNESRDEGEIHG